MNWKQGLCRGKTPQGKKKYERTPESQDKLNPECQV